MTRSVVLEDGRARLILPGTWVRVPLDGTENAQAHVRRAVRERVGRSDRLARLRRQAVDDLLATVGRARDVGAHTFLLALELLPGVPFPAAVVGTDARWPAAAQALVDAGRVEEALRESFPDREVVHYAAGPVARWTDVSRDSVGDTSYDTLHLEYVVPDPAGRLLVLRVNVPALPGVEPFATLFDEIVDSLVWAPRTDDGPRETP